MRLTLFWGKILGGIESRLDREYENVVPVLTTFVGEYENVVAVLATFAGGYENSVSVVVTFVGEYENGVAVLATFVGEYENRTPVVLFSAPALAHHTSTPIFLSVHRYGISQL